MSIEKRTMTAELRAEKGANGELYIRGYAATFNVESKDLGGFREVVAPGAFTRSLKEGGDVKALFNHDANHILGRKKNSTLEVAQDEKGLAWRCTLNPLSQAHRDLHAAVERGDIDECSFAFTAPKGGQVWAERADGNGGQPQIVRTLTDVNLFDVSVVTYPAYPGTEAGTRSDVVAPEVRSMLADFAAQRGLAVPPVEVRDEDESWEDEIAEVSAALCEAFPAPQGDKNYYGPCKYWVIETHDDYVIVCEQSQEGGSDYFRINYAVVDDKFTFGEPVAMEKVWVEAEDGQRANTRVAELRSLHSLASDHQYAADYHSAKAKEHGDAAKAIKDEADKQQARCEACNASMGDHDDSECECQNRDVDVDDVWNGDNTDDTDADGDDDNTRAAKAVRRAEHRAAFVAELEKRAEDGKVRTKKVDGKNLPASAFAYVGDKNDTSTWKLPVHDADHARNALARLNQTEAIPADKKAGVLRKLKSAAKKFGIDAKSLDDAERSLPMTADEIADYQRRGRAAMLGIKR